MKLSAIITFFILLFLTGNTSLIAQNHSENKKLRLDWIKKKQKALNNINIDTVARKSKLVIRNKSNFTIQKYRIIDSGLIRFESGEWIYITSHSEHENKKIGDIIIARDQKGNYYYNSAHVCGGIINFEAKSNEPIKSSKDFFRLFKDDVDDVSWEKLKTSNISISKHKH